jgi:hypothetical protein
LLDRIDVEVDAHLKAVDHGITAQFVLLPMLLFPGIKTAIQAHEMSSLSERVPSLDHHDHQHQSGVPDAVLPFASHEMVIVRGTEHVLQKIIFT